MNDNITFFRSQFEAIESLPDAEMRANAYKAMFDYAFNDHIAEDIDPISNALLISNKAIFDKRKEISKKRSEAGASKKQTESKEEQNETNENKAEQTESKANNNKNKNKIKNKNNILNTSSGEEIKLVLDTGEYYSVTNEQIQGWQQSVPLVDVKSELRKMQLWLEGNPKKRKTAKGITRFITGWLVREQNSKEQNSKPLTGIEEVPEWYADTKQTEPTPELLEEIEKMKESMRL